MQYFTWFSRAPKELVLRMLWQMSAEEVFCLAVAVMFDGPLTLFMLVEKFKHCLQTWDPFQKSHEDNIRNLSLYLRFIGFLHDMNITFLPFRDHQDDGFCYLSEVTNPNWLSISANLLGPYPAPWLVRCLYMAQEGRVNLPMAVKVRQEHQNKLSQWHECSCLYCGFILEVLRSGNQRMEEKSNRLLFREDTCEVMYHFCGFHSHKTISSEHSVMLATQHGDGKFLTSYELRQLDCFFTAAVGSPEVVDFDLETVLEHQHKNQSHNAESTIMPNDSASMITPRPLNHTSRKDRSILSQDDDVITLLSTQIANLTADLRGMKDKHSVSHGDYTKDEYDVDLAEAFQSSGVINKDGQLFLRPLAHTNASELVPKITVDERLNFLIRLHTAIFKIIPNTADYPRPGISQILKNAMEGKVRDDHPSFDLLQIVVTDTFDWQHGIIKNNNFMLPVVERGMRFNERIIAICLLSLKQEYTIRWGSLVKDCVLPNDITDTTRWSDSHDPSEMRRISARRPDIAVNVREHVRKSYKRSRRDSLFD